MIPLEQTSDLKFERGVVKGNASEVTRGQACGACKPY